MLVVDDEPGIVELVAMVLDDDRVAVLTAGDGVEALAIAHEERPKLVITDIMMPRMNGVELCERLRADPETQDTVVLLMSAAREFELGECGAVGLLSKPFDLGDLADTVHRHLGAT